MTERSKVFLPLYGKETSSLWQQQQQQQQGAASHGSSSIMQQCGSDPAENFADEPPNTKSNHIEFEQAPLPRQLEPRSRGRGGGRMLGFQICRKWPKIAVFLAVFEMPLCLISASCAYPLKLNQKKRVPHSCHPFDIV